MKTLNIYFDCEFTSLSPDAQLISIGMVTDEIKIVPASPKNVASDRDLFSPKSFYSEFTDFDLERCDPWVRENVVGKLKLSDTSYVARHTKEPDHYECTDNTEMIKHQLSLWLSQFSDYQITFVCDCGTYDWYHLVQLLAEWDYKDEFALDYNAHQLENTFARHEEELKLFRKAGNREIVNYYYQSMPKVSDLGGNVSVSMQSTSTIYIKNRVGLPKLPSNISPIPFDLNDLIAIKKGISAKEAFELNREELAFEDDPLVKQCIVYGNIENHPDWGKHNARWDAGVIKLIYNKLK